MPDVSMKHVFIDIGILILAHAASCQSDSLDTEESRGRSENCVYHYEQPWSGVKKGLVKVGVKTFDQCMTSVQKLPFVSSFGADVLSSEAQGPRLSSLHRILSRIADELQTPAVLGSGNAAACEVTPTTSTADDRTLEGEETLKDEVIAEGESPLADENAALMSSLPMLSAPTASIPASVSSVKSRPQPQDDGVLCSAVEKTKTHLVNLLVNDDFRDFGVVLGHLLLISGSISARASVEDADTYHLKCKASGWCINVGRFADRVNDLSAAAETAEEKLGLSTLSEMHAVQQLYGPVGDLLWATRSEGRDFMSMNLQSTFAACNYLYPACNQDVEEEGSKHSSPIPLCSSSCRTLRGFMLTISKLSEVSVVYKKHALTVSKLQIAFDQTCGSGEDDTCVAADLTSASSDGQTQRVLLNVSLELTSNVSLTLPPFPCSYPFIRTNDTSHYVPGVRSAIRKALSDTFDIDRLLLQDAVIDTLFPCGPGCLTPGYSQTAHNRQRAVITVVSWVVLITSLISCAVYFFLLPEAAKRPIHRRLGISFNITFAVAAIGGIPASFDISKDFYCFPDGTRRLGEPRTSFPCSLFGALIYAGTLNGIFLLACLSAEWLFVVKKLKGMTVARNEPSVERRRFLFYMLVSSGPTAILTAVLLAMQKINGTPLTGTCGISFDKLFYLLTVPGMVATAIAGVFITFGFALLHSVKRTVNKNQQEMAKMSSDSPEDTAINSGSLQSSGSKSELVSGGVTRRTTCGSTKNTEALTRLARHLLVYITSIFIMAAVNIAFGVVVFVREKEFSRGVYKHGVCKLMKSFNVTFGFPTPEQCPDLPVVSESLLFTLFLVFCITSLVFASWFLTDDVRKVIFQRKK